MSTEKTYLMNATVVVFVVVLLALGLSIVLNKENGSSFGGVAVGNEYQSVHIDSTDANGAQAVFGKTGAGSVGNVVVTQPASSGSLDVYDAASTTATSTGTLIASFDSSNDVAGTYVFDVTVTSGVMIDVPAGFDGEYTVTFR